MGKDGEKKRGRSDSMDATSSEEEEGKPATEPLPSRGESHPQGEGGNDSPLQGQANPPSTRIQLGDVTSRDVVCGRGFQPDSKYNRVNKCLVSKHLQHSKFRAHLNPADDSVVASSSTSKALKAIFICTS